MSPTTERFAAIDVGSNSIRCLIAERGEDGHLQVIDGETEARLAFLSVSEHFQIGRGRAVVADIGGGSLELVLAVGGLVDRVVSLPFGAVRLTEQYLSGPDDVGDGVRRLRGAVRRQLRRAVPNREWAAAKLFGSGGTFTNLARIAAARDRGAVPPGGVHGSSVPLPEAQRILEWLSSMSVAERRKVKGLNPERSDIIVAGISVAAEVLELFDAPKVTVSAFGLREGLLIHLSRPAADGPAPTRAKALRRFADRCRTDRRHGEQTARLARRLFDVLGKRLGCTPADWELLEAAALLHDVGTLVSYRSHHKHSYHLIAHAESLPFTPRERLLVALISRYHRKRAPSKKHLEFAALDPEDRALVRRLAALLRVACGLDRSHVSAVEAMRLRVLPDRVLVDVVPRLVSTDLKLELWGAQRKADLLAKLLKRDVVVRAAPLVEAKSAP